MAIKGKEIAKEPPPSSSKRKRDDSGKPISQNRRSTGVLQFFDVAADVVDREGDESDEENDSDEDFGNGVDTEMRDKNECGKAGHPPFFPKEEELCEEELDRMLEERYKPGSKCVYYAEDKYESKVPTTSAGRASLMPSSNDPIIWKVKCMVGRERQVAFCLIQKFVDLQSIGIKLKIVSVFSPEHIKGYIYIEAYKEVDILEACKGLCNIYVSRISRIPQNEVSHLLSIQRKSAVIPEGTWVRVKFGNYKGDLAQVLSVDDTRKKATIKLVPRIDVQALANKLAGEPTVKQTTVPTPRLVSSRDLEKFRSHIRSKRDSQTGILFETIDGMMLKDGFLYKKVSIDSLSYTSVIPSVIEIQRFKPCEEEEDANAEWLSQLYDGQSKEHIFKNGKGTTKESEGTSGTKKVDGFQLHDPVFFGLKDFGVIIGVEGDNFQILKDNVDEAEVVTAELHELKNGCINGFGILDKHLKNVKVNDTVRVLEGPLEGREGQVRQICKGTIFIYDESQLENGGYFCVKSHLCENNSHSDDSHYQNEGVLSGGGPAFEDSFTSPKSPELSEKPWQAREKKPWQARENNREFNNQRRGDKEGMFSTGQTVRIRVGPLKGYLGRVMAIYRSDITVKLDSQLKVVTVKLEHITEAGVKKSFGDPGSGFTNSFGGCGIGLSGAWSSLFTECRLSLTRCLLIVFSFGNPKEGSGAQAESSGWNSGVAPSTERDSWSNFPPASDFLLSSTTENPFGSLDANDESKKGDAGDDPWGKATPNAVTDTWGNSGTGGDNGSSWGKKVEIIPDEAEGDDPWGKAIPNAVTDTWGNPGTGGDNGSSWGKKVEIKPDEAEGDDPWGKATPNAVTDTWGNPGTGGDNGSSWGKKVEIKSDEAENWGNKADNWGGGAESVVHVSNEMSSWETAKNSSEPATGCSQDTGDGWGKEKLEDKGKSVAENTTGSWGKANTEARGKSAWGKGGIADNDAGGWGKAVESKVIENTGHLDQENSWGKATENVKANDGNQRKCWGKSSGDWKKSEGTSGDRAGNWGKEKDTAEGGVDEPSGWNKSPAKNMADVGWKKSVGNDLSSGWNQGSAVNREAETGAVRDGDGWNSTKASGEVQGSSWKIETSNAGDNQSSNWSRGVAANEETGGTKNQDGWNKGNPSGGDNQSSGWKCGTADACGGWNSNQGSAANETTGWGSQGDGGGDRSNNWNNGGNWGGGKSSDGDQSSGSNRGGFGNRGRGRSDQSGGWGGGNNDREDQSFGSGNRGGRGMRGGRSGGWNRGNDDGEDQPFGSGNRGGRGMRGGRSGGWSRGNDDGEDQSFGSGNRGGRGMRGGRSGGWNRGNDDGEDQTSGSGFRGRGGGGRSGGWGRGNNDGEDQTSGRGFRGRGGGGRSGGWGRGNNDGEDQTSGRGNRGRGMRGGRSGGWGRGRVDGEDRSFGNAGGGWGSSSGQTTNWNSGGSGWGGGNSSANDGSRTTEAGGGWNSQGSGNSSANDGGGTKEAGSGWGAGNSSGNDGGGTKEAGGGWGAGNSAGNDGGGIKEASGGWNSQGSGWGAGNTSANDGGDGIKKAGGGWISQGSGWGAENTSANDGGGIKEAGGGWNSQGSGWGGGGTTANDGGRTKKTGGTSIGGGGWGSQGSGCNQSSAAKESDSTKAGGDWGSQGSGCNQSSAAKESDSTKAGGGWNAQGSGWGGGNSSANDGGATKGHSTQSSDRKQGELVGNSNNQGGWNKEEGSTKEANETNKQAGGWNSQEPAGGSWTGGKSDGWK
ncbi:hypothetical protein GIB67_018004 [Kingdonia uniflora]|uniref:Protein RNA-directed DNA methylation 3 n=1 Tax=Kingdonia uniflora TaxID=39325 RepID=A0A7J7NWP4_9MAGN|nr:hypothetical protein GIB67_018004 [Kingdonia uniflora]